MRPVTLPQAEVAGEVASEVLLLLDSLEQRLVHALLVLCPASRELLLLRLLTLLEEGLLGALLVRLLVARKVLLVGDLLEGLAVEALDVDLSAGCDHVAGVDTAERHTVDLEGTSDKENTLGKDLEENDALAAETTGQEDQDSAGLEGSARLVGVLGLAGLK